MIGEDKDKLPEKEAKARFEAALRGARTAGPQHAPADPKKPKESKPKKEKPGR